MKARNSDGGIGAAATVQDVALKVRVGGCGQRTGGGEKK